MSRLWWHESLLSSVASGLSMLAVSASGLNNIGYIVSFDQNLFGHVVLGDLPHGFRQRRHSALRVTKHLDFSWITARNMLRKIRKAMVHRDNIYRLANLIELDDTFVGGKRAGRRGQSAEGKRPALVTVETREKGADFIAMQVIFHVCKESVRRFLAWRLHPAKR
jgi:hypothetical protein